MGLPVEGPGITDGGCPGWDACRRRVRVSDSPNATTLEPLETRAAPTNPAPGPVPATRRVAGVALVRGAVPHDFDAGELNLEFGDRVLVETPEGFRQGHVMIRPRVQEVPPAGLPRVVRKVHDGDDRLMATVATREAAARRFCMERIRALNLDMKLVKVEMAPRGGRAVFYFAAEHRVDFRELVSNLARQLRCRIEMRQIGVRDAAKMLGGFGVCGHELCCTAYMTRFAPVSIRMAKDQGLALNPQKVSGQCGRLLCCLTYEQETYRNLRAGLPRAGKAFNTVDGRKGRVRDVDVLRGRVRVWFESGVEEFTREQLPKVLGLPGPTPPELDDLEEGEVLPEHVDGALPAEEVPAAGPPAAETRPTPPPKPARPPPRTDEQSRRQNRDQPRRNQARSDQPRKDQPRRDPPKGTQPPRDGPRTDRPRTDQGRKDPPRKNRPNPPPPNRPGPPPGPPEVKSTAQPPDAATSTPPSNVPGAPNAPRGRRSRHRR